MVLAGTSIDDVPAADWFVRRVRRRRPPRRRPPRRRPPRRAEMTRSVARQVAALATMEKRNPRRAAAPAASASASRTTSSPTSRPSGQAALRDVTRSPRDAIAAVAVAERLVDAARVRVHERGARRVRVHRAAARLLASALDVAARLLAPTSGTVRRAIGRRPRGTLPKTRAGGPRREKDVRAVERSKDVRAACGPATDRK